MEIRQTNRRELELLAEIRRLARENEKLKIANNDLQISLLTTTEHGDLIEAQLQESNRRLQEEIAERRQAQATLQAIFEKVSRDKADLELILQATTEHGDFVEYELYTRAVETMTRSEELFRAISESTSILMFLLQEVNGDIAYANSIAGQRLGIDIPTLIGQNLSDFLVDPTDYPQMQKELTREGCVRNYEMQIRKTDGAPFWVSASVHTLPLMGQSNHLLITLYDISDRKQAEAALRESEEKLRQQAMDLEQRVQQRTAELQQTEAKYRSIFENAVEGIFQVTPEGQYLSANPSLADMFGYDSPLELMTSITDTSHQLYVQPRRRDELIAYLNRFEFVDGFESEVYCKDGTVIWISENVRSVQDQAGNLLYYEGSVRNITDRKTAEEELRRQRLLSEQLLLSVLPQPIAERLKRGETTIADNFSEVTVLFADIANFTQISSNISPVELVYLLNSIFSVFDKLAARHGVEKIKTIGDAYMVVGGLPKPRPDHVSSIADMALDMQREIKQFTTPDGQPITLRVGIHTGSVVAGIIGTHKFIYDLWGDTVNIASRMESHGEPGRIQVTQTIYDRLKKRYRFETRGEVNVKGKGLMPTFWLLDSKSPLRKSEG